MATNATRTQQATVNAVVQAALGKETSARRMDSSSASGSPADARKISGYGLPCAKCHLYYPADLDVCPTCKHNERVSPVVPKIPPRVAQADVDPIPDTAVVEQEREEFLRQFKSQLLEAHAEVVNPEESVCKFVEHHSGEPASAEICPACYERLQERLDVFEAALAPGAERSGADHLRRGMGRSFRSQQDLSECGQRPADRIAQARGNDHGAGAVPAAVALERIQVLGLRLAANRGAQSRRDGKNQNPRFKIEDLMLPPYSVLIAIHFFPA